MNHRHTLVSWLTDDDLRPGQMRMWEDASDPHEISNGWEIQEPFPYAPNPLLVCHAVKGFGNDGGYIALAITDDTGDPA